jgi:hypothetical protein
LSDDPDRTAVVVDARENLLSVSAYRRQRQSHDKCSSNSRYSRHDVSPVAFKRLMDAQRQSGHWIRSLSPIHRALMVAAWPSIARRFGRRETEQLHTLCVVGILQTTPRGFSRSYTKGNVSIETVVEQDPGQNEVCPKEARWRPIDAAPYCETSAELDR